MTSRHVVVATALVSLLGAAACNLSTVKINGHAMEPTLMDGDRAITTRSIDQLGRGDIVAFKYPRDESKSFVKRIVGLPGESIEAREGRVQIDGRPLEETYVIEANRSRDTWGPLTVPAGEYFMMGDNRRNSSDSRHWGMVRRAAIWAKVPR